MTMSDFARIGITMDFHMVVASGNWVVTARDELTHVNYRQIVADPYARDTREVELVLDAVGHAARGERSALASSLVELVYSREGSHLVDTFGLFGGDASSVWYTFARIYRYDRELLCPLVGLDFQYIGSWDESNIHWEPPVFKAIEAASEEWTDAAELAKSSRSWSEYLMRASLRGDAKMYDEKTFRPVNRILSSPAFEIR